MPITAQEFLAQIEKGEFPKGNICAGTCRKEVSTATTGRHWTAKGDMCSDCYYNALGAIVEQHPIFSPRVRRPGRPD